MSPAVALLAVLGACSSEPAPAPPTRADGSFATVSPSSGAPEATPPPGSGDADVRVVARQGTRAESAAWRDFQAARVAYINGHQGIDLRAVATAGQASDIDETARAVAEEGLALPVRPRSVIVARRPRAGGVRLGVCLWLPSYEFVDARTSKPALGPVPREWKPAYVDLKRSRTTLLVATVSEPDDPQEIDCEGLSP